MRRPGDNSQASLRDHTQCEKEPSRIDLKRLFVVFHYPHFTHKVPCKVMSFRDLRYPYAKQHKDTLAQ